MNAAESFVDTVRELLALSRAGTIPALWVDAEVIRVPWPRQQRETFRVLTPAQAKRILAGATIEEVLDGRRRLRSILPRKPPAAAPWQQRRAEYLHRKSA